MEDRSLLKSGQRIALGVLALGAVQSGMTLAMLGGDSPPMSRTPMPDPADGGAGSPPFPMNLTDNRKRSGCGAAAIVGYQRTNASLPLLRAGNRTRRNAICGCPGFQTATRSRSPLGPLVCASMTRRLSLAHAMLVNLR